MADNSKAPSTAMDYPEHERTYDAFIKLIKISIVTLIIILAGMAFFLV